MRRGPASARRRSAEEATGDNNVKFAAKVAAMAAALLLPILVIVLTGLSTLTMAVGNINLRPPLDNAFQSTDEIASRHETTIQSRSSSDYPNFDDLSSFFDFDIGPGKPGDAPSNKQPTNKYYFYENDYEDENAPAFDHPLQQNEEQVITPGTHYRPDESKKNQAVVGPYQVSVVDSKSPVLSSLGLDSNHLEMLAAAPRRFSANSTANMLTSDSIPPATYSEHPRANYPQSSSGYPPPSSSSDPSKYHPSSSTGHSDYHGKEHNHHHHHGPPPQGSYDAKSYGNVIASAPPRSAVSYNNYPPQTSSQGYPHHHQHHSSSYATNNADSWRPKTSTHTDWDDKGSRRPEPSTSYQSGSYPPHPAPLSHTHQPATSSHYPKPTYGTADRPRQTYSIKLDSSTGTGSYGSPSSGAHDHPPHSSGYHSSSSPTAKAPYRAGYASYTSSSASTYQHKQPEPPSKPGVTIRFKAKTPGSHGLTIPLNFNPLDMVKRLLPSLNPLKDRKVTIGITIENKNEGHRY